MLQRHDFRFQLGGHLIDQVGFGMQRVVSAKGRVRAEIAAADLLEHLFEPVERTSHAVHRPYGMETMDQDHEADGERP